MEATDARRTSFVLTTTSAVVDTTRNSKHVNFHGITLNRLHFSHGLSSSSSNGVMRSTMV